ncbi:hypothetical protein BDC45DRAFT_542667 [Circinella umbellata]|nr:hypothetical protein BDC45DRAFT_542667 [Circinella umbellata]
MKKKGLIIVVVVVAVKENENRLDQEVVVAVVIKDKKYISEDKLQILGQIGTMGSNLLELGDFIIAENNKTKYFKGVSKNGMIDISNTDSNSQVNLLNILNNSKLLKKLNANHEVEDIKIGHIVNLNKDLQDYKTTIKSPPLKYPLTRKMKSNP